MKRRAAHINRGAERIGFEMKDLKDTIRDYLDGDGIAYYEFSQNRTQDEFASYLGMFEGDDCLMLLQLRAEDQDLRVECGAGLKVPLDRADQVLRYIAGVNHAMRLGQFTISRSNNELMFVIGASFEQAELTRGQWKRIMAVALHVMSAYYRRLVQLLHDGREVHEPDLCGTVVAPDELDLAVERLLNISGFDADALGSAEPSDAEGSEPAGADTTDALPAPKRGRGRPPKNRAVDSGTSEQGSAANPAPKRGRGRPRKYPLPSATADAPVPQIKRGRGRPRKDRIPPA